MLTNFLFFAAGAGLTSVVFLFFIRQPIVGELQVDTDKEILQVAFLSPEELDKTIHKRQHATFRVVHKNLNWKVPQE